METIFCQSCGMPLTESADHGTERDGSLSTEYCTHCYKGGEFTQKMSMESMIDHCLKFLGEWNRDSGKKFTPEAARAEMLKYFPSLKRWRAKS